MASTRSDTPSNGKAVVEPSQRTSRRQQRIEEQRALIETARRQDRRKRFTWFGGIILVLVALVAGAMLLIQPPAPAQGRQVPTMPTANHVPQGTAVQYSTRPPSSGDHYDTPAPYGVYSEPVDTGNWVHSLEHGGIVVLYNCPTGCPEVVQQLEDVYNSAPFSRFFPGVRKVVVAPYTNMDSRIAVVAWGWIDEMEAVDKDRILAFYNQHVDRGPERAL